MGLYDRDTRGDVEELCCAPPRLRICHKWLECTIGKKPESEPRELAERQYTCLVKGHVILLC